MFLVDGKRIWNCTFSASRGIEVASERKAIAQDENRRKNFIFSFFSPLKTRLKRRSQLLCIGKERGGIIERRGKSAIFFHQRRKNGNAPSERRDRKYFTETKRKKRCNSRFERVGPFLPLCYISGELLFFSPPYFLVHFCH